VPNTAGVVSVSYLMIALAVAVPLTELKDLAPVMPSVLLVPSSLANAVITGADTVSVMAVMTCVSTRDVRPLLVSITRIATVLLALVDTKRAAVSV
jgi:hypothetical protein